MSCPTLEEFQTGCFCSCCFLPILSGHTSSLDVPAGVTQEKGHTGIFIHLPSAVRTLVFLARRIQPFLSLVDREVEFCDLIVLHFRWAFFIFYFLVRKIPFTVPGHIVIKYSVEKLS